MPDYPKSYKVSSARIDRVGISHERLTGRAGMVLFSRYLRQVGILPRLEGLFGSLRKSGKGLPVGLLFKQIFCFLLEGTSRHLVHFDALKQESGYAGAIEIRPAQMASSHAVKRFFYSFCRPLIWHFRRLLQELFIWRLRADEPEVIVLGIDTMVMDNDDAPGRHGVQPTYKRVKGFQPLQVTWGRFIVDAVFRGGAKHSNAGDTALKTIAHLVRRIRREYREEAPIIVRMDSGFFDQKLFALCEELDIGFICAGKLFDDIKRFIGRSPEASRQPYRRRGTSQKWQYVEFGNRRGAWDCFRRAFYTRPLSEDGQHLLAFARPDTILYTNLRCAGPLYEQLCAAGARHWTQAEQIIGLYHQRGADELVHRAVKEFRSEQLPFKRFAPNAAFYYSMLVAFFLYETFKEDVADPVIPPASYPTRLRRGLLDIAGKIICTGRQTILKVTAATYSRIRMDESVRDGAF